MTVLAKTADIRKMDSYAVRQMMISEKKLVENAAEAFFKRISSELAARSREFGKTVIICGGGNNGADGYALAKLLLDEHRNFEVISVFPPRSDEAIHRQKELSGLGKRIWNIAENGTECKEFVLSADTVIDAVFGVGYQSERIPENEFYRVIRWLWQSKALIAAVDMPSGISSDDGSFHEIDGCEHPICVKADFTVTFVASKVGLESAPGCFFAGKVFIEDIKMPAEAIKNTAFSARLSSRELFSLISPRRIDSNKGSFGKLLSFCGSRNMTGAAVLSALGAMSAGVGLMTCLAAEPVKSVLQNTVPEVTFIPLCELADGVIDVNAADRTLEDLLPSMTALLIGCGIGRDRSARRITDMLIDGTSCPIVIDADGLNLLADSPEIFRKHGERMIITPHPGEMSRILNTQVSSLQKNRVTAADFFAGEYGAVVVLKGFRTVIAAPGGKITINTSGNPGMAKAGMGDVLAGLIASLVAQKIEPYEAASLGVYVHGLAGDMAASDLGKISMRAGDLPRYIGRVFREGLGY